MTYAVAFDDTPLAREALRRARDLGRATGEDVVALTVVPEERRYALDRGWLGDDEPFSSTAAAAAVRRAVRSLAPDAAFRFATVEGRSPERGVARRLCRLARAASASVVFVGTESAGRVATSVSSVGESVSGDPRYDVYLVRARDRRGAATAGRRTWAARSN